MVHHEHHRAQPQLGITRGEERRGVFANQVTHESVGEHSFEGGADLDPHALARHVDDKEQPAPIHASPDARRA